MLCRKRLANRVTKIFEGGFNLRTVIPDVILLKGCNSSRYHLSKTLTAHKISVVSKVISCSWTLFMNPQVTQSAWNGVRSNTKVIYIQHKDTLDYSMKFCYMFCTWDHDFGFADTLKPCGLSEVLQAATYF